MSCLLLSGVNKLQVMILYTLVKNRTYSSVEWGLTPPLGLWKGVEDPQFPQQMLLSSSREQTNPPQRQREGSWLSILWLRKQRHPDKIKVRSQRATLMEVHLWLYSQWWWVTPGQPSTVCNVPSGCFTTGWEGSPVWIGMDLSTVGKEWHFQTVSPPHSFLYACGCLAIRTG